MTNRSGLNIVFAGTPDFAAAHLQALLEHPQHRVVAVYTQPDRAAGRGKKIQASPVKRLAEQAAIAVEQPHTLKDTQAQNRLRDYQADIMVVVAYGLLLPQTVLDIPPLGCINVHASLLPRWRGAAPIQRAIEAGDDETGITIMQMDAGLDTGAMLLRRSYPINAQDTAQSLHDRLLELGQAVLPEALDTIAAGTAQAQPQAQAGVSYAHKLSKDEAKIDWQQRSELLARKVRAFNPYPMCYCDLNGQRLRILQAQALEAPSEAAPGTIIDILDGALIVSCAEHSSLALSTVQLPGKKAMAVSDLLHGAAHLFPLGTQLS